MPRYRIHMINSDFESDGEADYPSLDAARKSAIKTATGIAAESVLDGVSSDGDSILVRNVVSLAVSDLSGGVIPA